MSTGKKNICILTYSLGRGGAEKVAATHSKMLAEIGYRVFIVSVMNDIQYDYDGELLNLGLFKDKKDGFSQRIHRLRIFKTFLAEKKIDVLIDHRSRNSFPRELLLKFFIHRNIKTIFMVHSSHLQQYFPKNKFLATFLYQKSHLVCVSKGVEKETKKTYPLENTSCIYNPIPQNIDPENVNSPETNFILFFGRFDESSKDLTFLINAYSKSILKSKNIKLILLGDGEDKLKLMELVANLALADFVIFKPYNPNPFSYVKSAMFTVLTSNYEGFGMSILESLACETPVVSVDCESGPKELIVNGFNGLLVKKELDTYIQALNSMATNKKLLATCKSNCLKSIEHFSPDHIKKEWKKLIDEVLLF